MVTSSPGSAGSSPLDNTPMRAGQYLVLLLAMLLSVLEGYDVMSMAFVAPAVGHAWHIGKTALGFLLSSGLIGMAAGSLGLTPLADVIGRRPVLLACVALIGASSLLSAFTHSVASLAGCRVLTGLGIGVMFALVTSLAAEFANARHRPLCVAIIAIGLPLGGVCGGLIASALLRLQLWPWVFVVGAIFAGALFPALLVGLPETPAFLITRRPANALARLNLVLVRLGHAPSPALPPDSAVARSPYRALFAPGMAAATLRMTLVNLLVGTAADYVISWLPQLITEAGFSPSTASLISATSGLAGMAASVALGALARITGPARLAAAALIGLGVALVAFGFAPPVLPLLMMSAVACGFFLAGATGVFYATLAATFTPLMRVSGIGFVSGVGRVFSAFGPYFAGWLFASGLTRGEVSSVFAASAAAGGAVLAFSPRR